MNKHILLFMVLFLLHGLAPSSLVAQSDGGESSGNEVAEFTCADPDYPMIQCENDRDTLNMVQCIVLWSDDSLACFPKPPLGFGDPTENDLGLRLIEPTWQYFWEFGDGRYLRKSSLDTIYHTYNEEGVYEVTLNATPTYSPTDKPPRRGYTVAIDTVVALNETTIFQDSLERENGKEILLDFSWDAIQASDSVTFIIRYRNLDESVRSGKAVLILPNENITLSETRNAPGDLEQRLDEERSEKIFVWDLGEVGPGESNAFFADFIFDLGYEDGNIDLTIGLEWEGRTSERRSWQCLINPN